MSEVWAESRADPVSAEIESGSSRLKQIKIVQRVWSSRQELTSLVPEQGTAFIVQLFCRDNN